MFDLVIRGARIVDGSGRAGFDGDIGVNGGVIAQVGGKAGRGRREIDANGALVTPGFVDVHTHYDGQVFWDPHLSPSSWHGVTTIVMGNCGIGFAPVRPTDRDSIAGLMEDIEDIPAYALKAGLPWNWETFPQFLDAIEKRPLAIDVGTQLPHAVLRTYVMGERGVANKPATEDDLREMGKLVQEGMRAGALGFTSTRSIFHKWKSGGNAPGYGVDVNEPLALARAVAAAGVGGTLGFNVDYDDVEKDIAWLRRARRETGLAVWTLLNQVPHRPDRWREVLDAFDRSRAAGEPILAQVAARPVCTLMGLTSSRNPFFEKPSFKAIANLPLAEKVARLRDPAFRRRLIDEKVEYSSTFAQQLGTLYDKMFRLGDPPDYEPTADKSVAAIAKREGRAPAEVVLDIMCERGGEELFFMPVSNYVAGDFGVAKTLLDHPSTIMGLGDGGAHVSRTCDSSNTTYMLAYWARDRQRGPKYSVEQAVKFTTSETSALFGLNDRGTLAPGKRADINIIDFDRLTLHAPEQRNDQPAGARRLVQRADGYLATIVAGKPIFENGEPTGELPGKLVRGRREAS